MYNLSGIVLAGGKSRRMGKDKAFLIFDNKPLIEIIIDKMKGIFKEVIVVTNNLHPYEKYKDDVILRKDTIVGCGPLSGLHAGLSASGLEHSFVVACDSPFLSCNLISYMADNARDFDAIVPRYSGFLQPLFAIYSKRNIVSIIEKQLLKGHFKLIDFLSYINLKILEEEEVRRFDPQGFSFTNINTYVDYLNLLQPAR